MLSLAVFVSGRGSNLRSLYYATTNEEFNAKIKYVIGSKQCQAVDFARSKNIEVFVLDKREMLNQYVELRKIFVENNIGLIVLAGFLKKIPDDFVESFEGKIINIHPALLPLFGGKGMYGMNVHKAVFESGMKVSGATVHFVDKVYDNGKIIFQKCIDINGLNNPDEIARKVLKIEHEILPFVVKKFAENKIIVSENRVIIN